MKKRNAMLALLFIVGTVVSAQVVVPHDLGDSVNTNYDNYFPFVSIDGNTLFFTVRGQKIADYSDENEDIYWSKKKNGIWQKSEPLDFLNTHNDEGAVALSADGQYLFFVMSNKRGDYGSADIYYTYNKDGQWVSPINAGEGLNTRYWESSPSVSRDMKTLYFSSNRPGGYGKKDLWQVFIYKQLDGTLKWGVPENMGSNINTLGEELAPFIHPDDEHLYFSSDGHGGYGGLDIFCAYKASGSETWGHVTNLGTSINSAKNEQGFIVDAKGGNAYFASNATSTNRRIFSMPITAIIPLESIPKRVFYIRGHVFDIDTQKPIMADIKIDFGTNHKTELTTSILSTGEYFLCLPSNCEKVIISAQKAGYLYQTIECPFDSLVLEKQNENGFERDVYMQPLREGVKMVLKQVFFDHDKYVIKEQSEGALQLLLQLMNDHPTLKIELGGYTDNQGSEQHNRILSDHRARAVLTYLVSKGVDEKRLKAMGYGSSYPIASNETEEGRAKNRRTEVKILYE